jgi:chromosome partitioning protein
MRVVALAQGKGGVGKSAAAINLACRAAREAGSAAVVDMDSDQATSLKWAKRRNGVAQPIVKAATVETLPHVLASLKGAGVKWVFLDLPGRDRAAVAMSAGIKAADFVLVPCRPLDVDIEASLPTVQVAVNIGKAYAYLMSIAPSQQDKQRARQTASFLRAHKHAVAEPIIVQRIMVPDALAQGLGISEAKPDSDSDREFAELFAWIKKEVRRWRGDRSL